MTVGVLQASLALEEELSLKAQLQKLLTVAKNLFTHLGEPAIFFGETSYKIINRRLVFTSGKAYPLILTLLSAPKSLILWLASCIIIFKSTVCQKQEKDAGRNFSSLNVNICLFWNSFRARKAILRRKAPGSVSKIRESQQALLSTAFERLNLLLANSKIVFKGKKANIPAKIILYLNCF